MHDFLSLNGPILLGEGELGVPNDERTTGRWGSVLLTDLDHAPVPLRGIPINLPIALTATLLPEHDRIHLPDRRELLGVGYAFALDRGIDSTGAAIAVGTAPLADRPGPWLLMDTLQRLTDRWVRLEAHVAGRPLTWIANDSVRETA